MMFETIPSPLVCEGDVGYNSKPRRGSLTFERLGNGKWRCVVRQVDHFRPLERLKLEKWALANLPSNIVQMCDKGSFMIDFINGSYLTFRAIDGQGAANLPKVAKLLLAIKDGKEPSQYGQAIYDMYVDSLFKYGEQSSSGSFNAMTVPGNQGYGGRRAPMDKWKNSDWGNRGGYSKPSGGYDGRPKGFEGHRGPQGQSQNRYGSRFLGCRTYGRSHSSDGHAPHSPFGGQRGRPRYHVQCKTSPLKNRHKDGMENSPGYGLEDSRRSSSRSRLLKDRGSADNSLERSEREFGSSDLSDNNFGASDNQEDYLSGKKSFAGASDSATKQDNRIVRMNGDCVGNSSTMGSHNRVSMTVADTMPTKNGSPSLGHMRFYGRNSVGNFSDRSQQFTPGAKYAPVKRQSLSSMVSPAKKNRSNSEEKENRRSVDGACNGSQVTDRRGFLNLGNSCYMNAVLQALFCLKSFSNDLLNTYQALSPCLADNSVCRRVCVLLVERMASNSTYATQSYSQLLKSIKAAVDASSNSFLGNKMQDAHEFLTAIFEIISKEIQEANKVAKSPQHNLSIRHYFEYKVVERSTCLGCSKIITNVQVMYDMGLPMPKLKTSMKSLQHLVNSLFKTEKRELCCGQCSHKEHLVKTSICTLPRILGIHLRRYNVVKTLTIKNANPIRVQKYLTLKDHVDENVEFLQTPACPGLSNGSTSNELPRPQCSDSPLHFDHHAEMEEKNLSKVNGSDGQSTNSKEKTCLVPGQSFSVYTANKKLGLVGGEGPLKDSTHADKVVEKSSVGDKEVMTAVPSNGPLPIPKHPETNDSSQFVPRIDDSKEWPNDEDEDLRKAKENSLRTLEEECNRTLERDEVEEIEDDFIPDQTDVENIDGELPHTYRLSSVICHVGSADSGHYTSYEADWQSNVFWHHDDTNVCEVTEHDFFQKIQTNGYILFYVHRSLCCE